jgi:mono/diheme cytochrome c family protein
MLAASRPVRAVAPQVAAPVSEPAASEAEYAGLLKKYCITCHNQRAKTGGLELDRFSSKDVPADAAVWEKVIRKLRAGAMPPVGMPRPDDATRSQFAAYLENAIDRAAAARPNPGRTETLHRLNRTEYQNAIRDLLALELDVSELVPADDQSYGFDNIAGVLKMSPTLLDRYVRAAREVSSLAVGASKRTPMAETFRLRSDLGQYQRMEGMPFGTRGGMAIPYVFPRDGEYTIKAELIDFMVQH